MGKTVACPGCGALLDYDAVPAYSQAKQRPGKYCPHSGCGHPLDKESAERDHVDFGADTAEANKNRQAVAHNFHQTSKGPSK